MGIVTNVRFFPVSITHESSLMARADIVLDGYLLVKDINIVKRPDGYKVGWPNKKTKQDSFYTVVIPKNEKIRNRIEDVIIRQYKRLVGKE